MSPTTIMRLVALSLLSISLSFVACAPKAKPLNEKSAVIEGAEFVLVADYGAFLTSKIGAKFDSYIDTALPKDAQKNKAEMDEFLNAAGVSEDDVKAFVVSVANMDAAFNNKPQDVKFLVGVRAAKAVNVDALYSYLTEKAKESAAKVTREEHEAVPLFVSTVEEDGKSYAFSVAIKNEGQASLVIVGNDSDVRAAVVRANAGQSGDLSKFTKANASLASGAQMALAYVLSDNAKQKIKEISPMFAFMGIPSDAAQAITSLSSVDLSIKGSELIDLELEVLVGNGEYAKALQSVLTNALIASAKAGAQKQFGAVPNFVNSMAVKATDAKVALSLNMNEADLDLMKEQAAAKK